MEDVHGQSVMKEELENPGTEISTDNKNDLGAKIKDLFGEVIFNAFKREEVDNELSITDLLERESDAPIFGRLCLSYGKAVRFKHEFNFLRRQYGRTSVGAKTCTTPLKPSMADLQQLEPDMRQLYLTKRKRIGVLAANKWKGCFPKFNSPQLKAELEKFAEDIEKECGIPEINFGKDGIIKHVKSFFNEQRRYKKRKSPTLDELPSSQSSPSLMQPLKKEKQLSSEESSSLEEESLSCMGGDMEYNESGDTDLVSSEDDNYEMKSASPKASDPETTSPKAASTTKAYQVEDLPIKIRRAIIKGVFGKILSREESVSVLKKKFLVPSKSLTSLSATEIMSVVIRKLLKQGYCNLNDQHSLSEMQTSDIVVSKEISL